MDEKNPIYDYLVSEGVTDLDEESFIDKYTDRDNLKGVYDWLKENGNTDLDFEPFADKYFPLPKQQEVSAQGSENTSLTSIEPSQTSQTPNIDSRLGDQELGTTRFDLGLEEEASWAVPPVLPETDGMTVEMGQPIMLPNPKEFLPQFENILNNNLSQFKGIDERAEITVNSLLKKIIGEAGADSFYNYAGIDIDQEISDAYQRLDEYALSNNPVTGFTDSEGLRDLSVAITNAVFSVGYSALLSTSTFGIGLASDMVGGSVYEANSAKAQNLGITVKELYDREEDELLVPALIGAIGYSLERIGLRGMKSAMTRAVSSGRGKYLLDNLIDVNKEGMTEWLQGGLEEINTTLATGGSLEDASNAFGNYLTSREGFEQYLMGVVGSGVFSSAPTIVNTITHTNNRQQAIDLFEQRNKLISELNNENVVNNQYTRNAVLTKIENLNTEIKSVIDKDNSESVNISPDQLIDIQTLNNEIHSLETLLVMDETLSEEVRTAIQEDLSNKQSEKEDFISSIEVDQTTETTIESEQLGQTDQVSDQEGETVQQNQEFSTTEQSEAVNTEVGQVIDNSGLQFANPEQRTSFLQDLTNSDNRTNRLNELRTRMQQYRESDNNLGIVPTDPEQRAEYWRDATEYAILSVVDGTVRTAKQLANSLGINSVTEDVQKAFDTAKSVQTIISENTVTPARTTVKGNIRKSTLGGVQGTETLTSRQALTNQIRTLNRGARDMAKNVRDLAGTINAYITANKDRLKGTSFSAGTVGKIARSVSGVTNENQLNRALDIVDRAIENAQFRAKLNKVSSEQSKLRKKAFPKDLKSIANEFSRIEPVDLNPEQLDSYLDMLSQLNSVATRPTSVNASLMQRMVDLANANKEVRENVREQERNIREADKEYQERREKELRKRLKEKGLNDSEIDALTDDSNLFQERVRKLQEVIQELTPTRADMLRNNATEQLSEARGNVDQFRENMNPSDFKVVEDFINTVRVEDFTNAQLVALNYVLHNLNNNNSIVGMGTLTEQSRAVQEIAQSESVLQGIESVTGAVSRFVRGQSTGAVKREQLVKDSRESLAKLDVATGVAEYSRNFNRVIAIQEELTKTVNDIYRRHQADFRDSRKNLKASIYAIVSQYRSSWANEEGRIENEYKERLIAVANTLKMLSDKRNSVVSDANQDLIANLESVTQELFTVTEIDTNPRSATFEHATDIEIKMTQEQLWDSLGEGQKEYYNTAREFFETHKEEFFSVEKAYSGKDVDTDWQNYFPIAYYDGSREGGLTYKQQLSNSPDSLVDLVSGAGVRSTIGNASNAGETRIIEGRQLPRGSLGFDFEVFGNFENYAGRMLFDTMTKGNRYYTSYMLDYRNNGMMQTYEDVDFGALDQYADTVAQKVIGDRNQASFSHGIEKSTWSKIVSLVRLVGTTSALASGTQFIKQSVPIIETLFRLKNKNNLTLALKLYMTEGGRAFIQKFREASNTSQRNITRNVLDVDPSTKRMSVELQSKLGEITSLVGGKYVSAVDRVSSASLWTLTSTDKSIADISWIAMYLDYTTDGGNKPLNLNTDLDLEASAFADQQNNVIMNVSETSMRGGLMDNDIVRFLYPFMSFSINAGTAFANYAGKARQASRRGDQREVRRNIGYMVGSASQLIAFNAITWGIRVAMIKAGYGAIISLASKFGNYDDEEEKLEAINKLREERQKKLNLNDLRSIDYTVADALTRGFGGEIFEPLTNAVSYNFFIKPFVTEQYLKEVGYSGSVTGFSKGGVDGMVEMATSLGGTLGVGTKSFYEAYKSVRDAMLTDPEFILRTTGFSNPTGKNIEVEDLYLTDFDKYGIMNEQRIYTSANALVQMGKLFGASDQMINSMMRYAGQGVRLLSNEYRGKDRGASDHWRRDLMLKIRDFSEIPTSSGEPIKLSLEDNYKYSGIYLKNVEQLTSQMESDGSDKQMPRKMYYDIISKTARKITNAQYISENPSKIEESAKKSAREAVKDAQELQRMIKARNYNELERVTEQE